MSIDIAELKKMAKLSRLHVPQEKAEALCSEINSMFRFVDQLDEIDVQDVEPFISTVRHPIPMRSDIVTDGNKPEEILQNAPVAAENFFLVPKVIE